MAFVLDNSVVIGWFISTQSTPYTRRVAKRAERERVVVPALWDIEFANVMLVLQRRERVSLHDVAAILAKSLRLPFTIDRDRVAAPTLVEIAQRHSISAYDAAYLELAMRRGISLATRDEALQRAASEAGVFLK